MDFHDLPDGVTAAHIAEMHQSDLKIEHKYNCRGLTYWCDERRQNGFLFNGSSKRASGPAIDVTRIIAQTFTGVGFLGAGVIFREGVNVHGLGSAATIWYSAAIGCIAASGLFIETLICTLLVVIINSFLQPLDNWLKNRN